MRVQVPPPDDRLARRPPRAGAERGTQPPRPRLVLREHLWPWLPGAVAGAPEPLVPSVPVTARSRWSCSCCGSCDSLWLCGSLWFLLVSLFVVPCGSLWFLVVPCGSLWFLVVPCGSLWFLVVPCGSLLRCLIHCGA